MWCSGKKFTCQCRKHRRWGFDPWVKKNALEKEMSTHSSIPAWKIPWTEEPDGLQYTRLLCPPPSPRVCSNSCPLSQSCHPPFSSSVTSFSSCLQSFPASGYFPLSRLFASGGQKYWSFSFSISPSNEYSGLISFRIDWFDLLVVQGTLKSVLQHHHFFGTRLLYGSTLTSIHN